MYTIKDVTETFKISRKTVYKWIKNGWLKPVKIGGSVRFPAEQVERLKRGEM